jgi:cystathionine beta-lyase/cystathionine gamma-synthase
MPPNPDDLCPQPDRVTPGATEPLVPPIYPAAVYRCDDPAQADALLSGEMAGYIYRRDAHPNAQVLADKCRLLHAADHAAICGSGMSALSAALLAHLQSGDHVVVSDSLYGRTTHLFNVEARRLGIQASIVDVCDLPALKRAVQPGETKLVVLETISNPLLRVADLAEVASIAHSSGAQLLVDNTFASPAVCRPLELGADLVMESLTKIMNGHSDVLLGLVCGQQSAWDRVDSVIVTWGLGASPFDCWLAARGLGTMALRVERSNDNALSAAEFLAGELASGAVQYPGLENHPDHALAARQFLGRFGSIVTFTLPGGTPAATAFMKGASRIAFSPSLGDLSTTLSHPESTSHRSMSPADRRRLGIEGGTIRLSVGIESPDWVRESLAEGLRALT